jgi:LacI family transcriptional regulator
MVDGIILASTENGFEKSLAKCASPVVLVDREINLYEKAGRILVNNEESAFTATDFLIKNGCRNIGFISSGHNNKPSLDRLYGYKRGLEENGIHFDEDKVYQNNYTIETGYTGINILLNRTTLDGLFCGNDLIAIGAIKGIKERNIEIPKQIKVMGFDDILISKYIEPPLTTMKQPAYKMGEESVKMLIDLICGKHVEKTVILKTELIKRLSV